MKYVSALACILVLVGSGCQTGSATQGGSDSSFEQRARCQDLGSRYRNDYESDVGAATFLEPIYGYSKYRNTCLYVGGLIADGSIQEYVIDLLTNRKVVQYMMMIKGGTMFGDQEAFKNEKERFEAELSASN